MKMVESQQHMEQTKLAVKRLCMKWGQGKAKATQMLMQRAERSTVGSNFQKLGIRCVSKDSMQRPKSTMITNEDDFLNDPESSDEESLERQKEKGSPKKSQRNLHCGDSDEVDERSQEMSKNGEEVQDNLD